ncbi:hypothetical protein [Thalassomonas sp. RHCl1]|uniref:hypothetical protein n=1 Tax=Thalassomonas sp. RHCl1 TaxID=2995320 RepID=UPI00248B354D|nr:hypothetical protein [Thalassomonas sp. RHCl1]
MHLLKGYWRGFVGGPDFNDQQTLQFILEDHQLSINLPQSNLITEEPPRPVNFPYKSEGWFDSHKEQQQHNSWVHINTALWMYLPVISFTPSSEYGMLGCSLWIKRLPAGAKIDPFNLKALARFVIDEYDSFHNGDIDENLAAGRNTQIKRDLEKESAARSTPYSEERFAEALKLDIECHGQPPIPPAKIVNFDNHQWVFYQEVRANSRSRKDYYCLGLDQQHYLVCRFTHRVDLGSKHKKWRDHAFAAQEKIIKSIALTPIEESVQIPTENTAGRSNLLETTAAQKS